MLNSEWEQLLGQLQASRGADTKCFSFVDTISARNYAGTNDCHGWVGLRIQAQPNGSPNDVILHLNLRDSTNVQQQEPVGILGVNLIYAAYQAADALEEFLASVFEDLGLQRVEIDCVELKGPAFESWDRDQLHAFQVESSSPVFAKSGQKKESDHSARSITEKMDCGRCVSWAEVIKPSAKI